MTYIKTFGLDLRPFLMCHPVIGNSSVPFPLLAKLLSCGLRLHARLGGDR